MLAAAIGLLAVGTLAYSRANAAAPVCSITTESNPSLSTNGKNVMWTWGVDCSADTTSYNVYTSANDVTTGKAYGITGTGSPFNAKTKSGFTESKAIPTCVASDQWTVKVAVRVASNSNLITGPTTTSPISLCGAPPPPPPTVSITNPTDGSAVPAANDEIDATATNAASVAFSVDGNSVATDTSAPYTANWNATGLTPNSSHTITATATNTSGFATSSVTVTIAPPPAPTVSITNPPDGSQVAAATDEIDATATSADSVTFNVDGTDIATDTSAPYTAFWNALGDTPNSSHVITATATNFTGTATSTVTVTIAPPPAPTVTITKPTDGSTVPAAVDEIDATANSADSVTFNVDGTDIATDTSAPYTTNWDASAATPGSQHVITATATNFTGTATATSTVTIAQPGAITHIITLFDENHNQTTVTPTTMPYLASLSAEFAHTNNYSAVQSGSLGNYMAATSGFNVPSSDCQASAKNCATTNDNIFNQLNGHWQSIAQSMPSNCYKSNFPTGAPANMQTYVPRHNPAVYYSDLATTCPTNVIPQGATVNINPNATYTWITPDLNNDAHNGSQTSADTYLQNLIPQLLADPNYTNGSTLIELSWDEGSGGSEKVLTVFLYPTLDNTHKVLTGAYTHYSLLRLNEELLNLPILGNAQTATDMRAELGL
jgi:hypothetical protein